MGLTALVDRHSELVGRMTETLDIDLVAAAQSGAMPEEGLRSVVYACTGCSQAGACGEWLDAHEGGADSAPGHLSAQAPARMMAACHSCAFPEVCTVWRAKFARVFFASGLPPQSSGCQHSHREGRAC